MSGDGLRVSADRSPGARAAVARAQRTALTVVLAIFGGSWAIVGALLAPIAGGWRAIAGAVVLFTVLPLAVFIRSRSGDHYPGAAIRLFVFRPMWYAQLLLILSALGGAAAAIIGLPFGVPALAGRFAIATIAAVYLVLAIVGYAGSRRLVVTRLAVTLPSLPPELEGLRVAQICDTHIGPHISTAQLARVAAAVREARPDVIVVAGDLIDDYARDVDLYAAAFGDLTAPLGVFVIAGNHEVYAGWNEVRPRLEALRVTLLVNDGRVLEHRGTRLAIVGTGDPAAGHRAAPGLPAPDLAASLASVPAGVFTIVLAHNPALWPPLAAAGVPLTLSGHTHWGQFSISRAGWSLANPFLRQAMGPYRSGDSLLYVHPGTGYWGIPFRVGAPAEVAILTLARGRRRRSTARRPWTRAPDPADHRSGFAAPEILAHVARAPHPHERARDHGEPAHEGDRALRVGRESRKRLAHLLRQLARELRLQQRRAGDDGDAELRGGLEHGDGAVADALRGRPDRLVEREVHGQLHRAKVVVVASRIARARHEHLETQVSARVGRRAQPVPCCAAVAGDLAHAAPLLEQLERAGDALPQLALVHRVQLLFRVVQVVEIDGLDAEVGAAARELVGDERRREAVAARDDLVPRARCPDRCIRGHVFLYSSRTPAAPRRAGCSRPWCTPRAHRARPSPCARRGRAPSRTRAPSAGSDS